jgi:hypothetical protein
MERIRSPALSAMDGMVRWGSLEELHLASRTQATLYALRQGLASLDDGGEAPRKL